MIHEEEFARGSCGREGAFDCGRTVRSAGEVAWGGVVVGILPDGGKFV